MLDFDGIEDTTKEIIKVIGVGGGGCNAVNNMFRQGIENVSFAVCNTDSQSLSKSPVPIKIQLGGSGLGAGANPELARKEALETEEQIERIFQDGTKMCFITAGMGGGTGTGAAPIVASLAQKHGILVVGIVTIPFFFEKRDKIVKALKGVEEMRKNVDALLIVNNERICDIYSEDKVAVKDAFKAADNILCDATKSISELITKEGDINLDFRDVETTMKGGGGALMAIGRANGEKRVERAILNALESPLLYGADISKAKRILFNIYTSDKNPLLVSEMQEIDAFMYELNPDIQVIWGTSTDNSLEEDAKIIILATGLDNEFLEREETPDDINYYNRVIEQLYREAAPMPLVKKGLELKTSLEDIKTEKQISSDMQETGSSDLNAHEEFLAEDVKEGSSSEIKEEETNEINAYNIIEKDASLESSIKSSPFELSEKNSSEQNAEQQSSVENPHNENSHKEVTNQISPEVTKHENTPQNAQKENSADNSKKTEKPKKTLSFVERIKLHLHNSLENVSEGIESLYDD